MIVKHAIVFIQAPDADGFEVDGKDTLALRIFKLMGFPDRAVGSQGACSVEVDAEGIKGRCVAGRYCQSFYG